MVTDVAQRKKLAQGLSPEEKYLKAVKARRRFKAFVRLVLANLFWLGDLDDTLGEDVLLNIQKLTRKKIKKSTLTTKEKIILSKPTTERTEEEKHLLNRAIGGLRCFRRYPPEVKGQLAAVTYFVYFGPDRVIVKQDHLPSAMYFLLSGEALVKVKVYDKVLKEYSEYDSGTVGPGTMFGEVALIHGIARTATIITCMPCELLMIKKEDFDIVLKETVWKAWEEIGRIMKRYSYFKNWDSVTKRECSIISRTKNYVPDEVILGDKAGLMNYSYLIIKGSCSIIEHLQVLVHYVHGVKKYRLVTCDADLGLCMISRRKKKAKAKAMEKSFVPRAARVNKPVRKPLKMTRPKSRIFTARKVDSLDSNISDQGKVMLETQMETHFIRVCQFTEGAIFNIGEKFERRRIVANENTSCLLIPRYWLMKMNKDNIWNRVQQFLNRNIPTTRKVFDEWIKEKKFLEYRQKLVKDILVQKRVSNTNCIHNVPYSIRLKEKTDDYRRYL